jgi:hypothetical protein
LDATVAKSAASAAVPASSMAVTTVSKVAASAGLERMLRKVSWAGKLRNFSLLVGEREVHGQNILSVRLQLGNVVLQGSRIAGTGSRCGIDGCYRGRNRF